MTHLADNFPVTHLAARRFLASLGVTLIVLLGALTQPCPALAQQAALPRTDVVRQLGERYAEAPVALGLSSTGGVIEVFAARDGSTWTMVLTMPDGLSALIAAGADWTRAPLPAPADPPS